MTADTEQVWFTPQEAAAYLRISIPTLYRLTAAGFLACYHVGRSRRYKREDLDALPQGEGRRATEGATNAARVDGRGRGGRGGRSGKGMLTDRAGGE